MHHPPLKSVLQNVTLKRTVVFVSNKRKPLRKICRWAVHILASDLNVLL